MKYQWKKLNDHSQSGIKLSNWGSQITNSFSLSQIKNNPFSFFTEPYITQMFQNIVIKFLILTKLQRKQQPKHGLLRFLASLFTQLNFSLNCLGLFYSKTNSIFWVSIQFMMFWVWLFDMYVWMTYIFCVIKNKRNNLSCTGKKEK